MLLHPGIKPRDDFSQTTNYVFVNSSEKSFVKQPQIDFYLQDFISERKVLQNEDLCVTRANSGKPAIHKMVEKNIYPPKPVFDGMHIFDKVVKGSVCVVMATT